MSGVSTDLIVPVLFQEVSGHVAGQDVPQHVFIMFSQLLHFVDLLFGLDPPQEVQPGRVLQLKTRDKHANEVLMVYLRHTGSQHYLFLCSLNSLFFIIILR